MNVLLKYYQISKTFVRIWHFVKFRCFQNILWHLSYNSGENKFQCNGRLYNCKITISGEVNTIIINEGVRLANIHISVDGNRNLLVIGAGTRWEEGGRIRIEDQDNTIRIGENCDLRGCFLACGDKNTNIIIGDDCLFSANVVIRTSDSHSIINSHDERLNPGKDVIIGNHVWMGNGATILKGTVVGNECVVGTNAVVSGKNINEGSVVVGNPAKVVKTGITWDYSRIY